MEISDKIPVLDHSKEKGKNERWKEKQTAKTKRKYRRAKKHAQKALKKWNMCYESDDWLNALKLSPRESIREQLHFLTPPPQVTFPLCRR